MTDLISQEEAQLLLQAEETGDKTLISQDLAKRALSLEAQKQQESVEAFNASPEMQDIDSKIKEWEDYNASGVIPFIRRGAENVLEKATGLGGNILGSILGAGGGGLAGGVASLGALPVAAATVPLGVIAGRSIGATVGEAGGEAIGRGIGELIGLTPSDKETILENALSNLKGKGALDYALNALGPVASEASKYMPGAKDVVKAAALTGRGTGSPITTTVAQARESQNILNQASQLAREGDPSYMAGLLGANREAVDLSQAQGAVEGVTDIAQRGLQLIKNNPAVAEAKTPLLAAKEMIKVKQSIGENLSDIVKEAGQSGVVIPPDSISFGLPDIKSLISAVGNKGPLNVKTNIKKVFDAISSGKTVDTFHQALLDLKQAAYSGTSDYANELKRFVNQVDTGLGNAIGEPYKIAKADYQAAIGMIDTLEASGAKGAGLISEATSSAATMGQTAPSGGRILDKFTSLFKNTPSVEATMGAPEARMSILRQITNPSSPILSSRAEDVISGLGYGGRPLVEEALNLGSPNEVQAAQMPLAPEEQALNMTPEQDLGFDPTLQGIGNIDSSSFYDDKVNIPDESVLQEKEQNAEQIGTLPRGTSALVNLSEAGKDLSDLGFSDEVAKSAGSLLGGSQDDQRQGLSLLMQDKPSLFEQSPLPGYNSLVDGIIQDNAEKLRFQQKIRDVFRTDPVRQAQAIEAVRRNEAVPKWAYKYMGGEDQTSFEDKFLQDVEAMKTKAYLDTEGNPTIGIGVNLAAQSLDGLRDMNVPEEILQKISPLIGTKGSRASSTLKFNPVELSEDEAMTLSKAVQQANYDFLNELVRQDTGATLEDLPIEGRTVLLSLGYNFGSNLKKNKPEIWNAAMSGKWDRVQSLLKGMNTDKKGLRNRRLKEAALLNPLVDKKMELAMNTDVDMPAVDGTVKLSDGTKKTVYRF